MTSGDGCPKTGPVLIARAADRPPPRYPLPAIIEDSAGSARLKRASRPALALVFLLTVAVGLSTFLAFRLESPILAPVPDEATMGAVLAAGGLYHVDADQLDNRALVTSRIRNLKDTPDVVVVADRSWQLVQQDLRWRHSVFGAYIDGLTPSDLKRIAAQLSTAGRMPRRIVLGIAPEYVTQPAPVLKLASLEASAGGADTQGLPHVQTSLQVTRVPPRHTAYQPRPGLTPYHAELDTIYPDGSVVWSMQRRQNLAKQDATIVATQLAHALRQRVEASSSSQIVETGEAIAELKSQGVEVVIALTPLHPAVYRQIYNRQTAFRLHEGIEDLLAMARGLDVVTLGSFEPFAAGCLEADFASIDVPAPSCLARLLDAGFIVARSNASR